MSTLTRFYDRYHLKNKKFGKVISKNNFTYFYILDLLHKACIEPLKNKRVLDLGSGVGAMSLYFADHGAQVTGVDISPRAVEIAQQAAQSLHYTNVKFVHGDVMKQIPDRFDVVVIFEVIEHIETQEKLLQHIRQNLKPTGLLVLSTPSKENWLYRWGFYKQFDEEVGHVRRYTRESLRQVLTDANFDIIELRQVEGPLRNILFTTKLGFLIRFIKGPLIPLFHVCDRLSGWVFGYSDLQVIAQKS